MLHHNTIDHLLLDVILALEFALPVRARPRAPPLFCRRRVLVLEPPHDPHPLQHRALDEWLQHDVIIGHRKVERPHARVPALVRRRLHDTVDRRLVEAPREELHAVASVHDERVRNVLDVAPDAVRGEDLERGDGLGPKDGDSAEVGVALEPDVVGEGLFLGGAWVAGEGSQYLWDAKKTSWLSTYYFMKRTAAGHLMLVTALADDRIWGIP